MLFDVNLDLQDNNSNMDCKNGLWQVTSKISSAMLYIFGCTWHWCMLLYPQMCTCCIPIVIYC